MASATDGEAPAGDAAVERHKMKEVILKALQKLNDKDTAQTGSDEMKEIIQARVPFRAAVQRHDHARVCTVPFQTRNAQHRSHLARDKWAWRCLPASERRFIAGPTTALQPLIPGHGAVQKHLDMDMIAFALPVLCQPGQQSLPVARKESMKLLSLLTSKHGCPHSEAVISHQGLLGRACQYGPRQHQLVM